MTIPKKLDKTTLFGLLIIVLSIALFWAVKTYQRPAVSAISRDGVVSEIQKLSHLTTVRFGVDTVISAHKEGSWQKLWQDEQKGLFIAKGRVLAGVDLSKITADDVEVHYAKEVDMPPKITIKLPPSQIFEVFLDDIEVYDWQTGLFGVVENDPQILKQAQETAKAEVLKKACQGDIMTLAKDGASEQVKGLFALMGATVVVETKAGECVQS